MREDNAWTNKTVAYTYDNGGNILSIGTYELTSASDLSSITASFTSTYGYTDANWKDKLTSYNGLEITYDEIGNPINYYRGYTFEWENGRQLAGISGTNLEISYTYNSDGIRTSKTVNGVTTTYLLEGNKIIMQTDGTDTMWFHYDASGSPVSFELNGSTYFYVKNLQGDIIAITSKAGYIGVEYKYDSWGSLVSMTGPGAATVGLKNPLRYRGYYYDKETILYYLNSRYYDPVTKRFVNQDIYNSTGQGTIGNNMFAYCLNNPINQIDASGTSSLWYDMIENHDMGFIHRAVQAHIEENYSDIYREMYLSNSGRRADIIQYDYVWEVKHASKIPYARTLVAQAQARSYVGSTYKHGVIEGLGAAKKFKGSFHIQSGKSMYLITYKTPAKGAILYNVRSFSDPEVKAFRVFEPQKETAPTTIRMSAPRVAPVILTGVGLSFLGAFSGGRSFNYYTGSVHCSV